MQTPHETLPTREAAKRRARELRMELAAQGTSLTHSAALELVARELGYRDWNTASARLSNRPEFKPALGMRVTGTYLKQPFRGEIIAAREMAGGEAYEITIQFDEPVDVVSFDSFSAFRHRVTARVSSEGESRERTGDGERHMVVAEEE
ncbi:hypothetical protein FHS78_002702 [Parvibaculum indicum]|uniref:glyoxalase superfamily protein n=1 Tax=Parvibaculum indicum TaxID=562969 RepID=UPI00141DB07F|nr:glyoxalase superfamily protein [Parvibaculum indicum]NIJ42408.1 hypothetical protein [Parvibaculum indicum]